DAGRVVLDLLAVGRQPRRVTVRRRDDDGRVRRDNRHVIGRLQLLAQRIAHTLLGFLILRCLIAESAATAAAEATAKSAAATASAAGSVAASSLLAAVASFAGDAELARVFVQRPGADDRVVGLLRLRAHAD